MTKQQQIADATAMRAELARAVDMVVAQVWDAGPSICLSALVAVVGARAQHLVREHPSRETEVLTLLDQLRALIEHPCWTVQWRGDVDSTEREERLSLLCAAFANP